MIGVGQGRGFHDPLFEANEAESERSLREYAEVVSRHWRLIAVATAVALLVALAHYYLASPKYLATATLQIERRNTMAMVDENLFQLDRGDSPDSAYYQTQYELLRSQGIAERVVRALDLANDPRFAPKRAALGPSGGESAADGALLHDLAARLLADLQVQPVNNTYLVRISYVDEDPRLAAQIVDAVTAAYIDWGIEVHSFTTDTASNFLSSQVATLKQEIADKEAELAAHSQTANLVTADPGTNPVMQRLDALNRDHIAAVSERIEKEARYQELANTPAESVADPLSGGLVPELRSKLVQLEQEYATKSETFKSEWPGMQDLESEIDETRTSLDSVVAETAGRARRAARTEYQTALRREQRLAEELAAVKNDALSQSSATVVLSNLQVEVSTRRALLDQLMRRQSETEVAARLKGPWESNVRILSPAVEPRRAFFPDWKRNLGMGLGLGLVLGVAGAFLREFLDRTIKSSEEAERILGLPVLAAVPDIEEANAEEEKPGTRKRMGRKTRFVTRAPEDGSLRIELLAHTNPRLPASEAYRSLRTALLLSRAEALRSVAVVSAVPREGKSVTASNLAVVMAQLGRDVLLIDADLRKPRVHKIFEISNRVGLVNHLTGQAEPAQIMFRSSIERLYLCPAGPVPPNPSELLAAPAMAELLTLARSRFDFVIVDCPPVLPVTDSTIVGALVDGTVLCLRAHEVDRQDALAAVERLAMTEVEVLGIVLNGHRLEGSMYRNRYAYSHGQYGYSEYGERAAGSGELKAVGGEKQPERSTG